MAGFNIEVPHPGDKDSAKTKLQTFLEKVRDKYQDQVSNLEESWDGDVLNYAFTTYGFNIKGALEVKDDKVAVQGSLPFAALAFRGKIEETIKTELEKQLA